MKIYIHKCTLTATSAPPYAGVRTARCTSATVPMAVPFLDTSRSNCSQQLLRGARQAELLIESIPSPPKSKNFYAGHIRMCMRNVELPASPPCGSRYAAGGPAQRTQRRAARRRTQRTHRRMTHRRATDPARPRWRTRSTWSGNLVCSGDVFVCFSHLKSIAAKEGQKKRRTERWESWQVSKGRGSRGWGMYLVG